MKERETFPGCGCYKNSSYTMEVSVEVHQKIISKVELYYNPYIPLLGIFFSVEVKSTYYRIILFFTIVMKSSLDADQQMNVLTVKHIQTEFHSVIKKKEIIKFEVPNGWISKV